MRLHTSPDWSCLSRAFVLWGHLGDLGPKSRPSITSMASDPCPLHTFKQHLCGAGPGLAPCLTSTSSSQRMAEARLPALGSLPWRGQGPALGPEFGDRQSQEGNRILVLLCPACRLQARGPEGASRKLPTQRAPGCILDVRHPPRYSGHQCRSPVSYPSSGANRIFQSADLLQSRLFLHPALALLLHRGGPVFPAPDPGRVPPRGK